MKKILLLMLAALIMAPPAFGQVAGQDKFITYDDVMNLSYFYIAGWLPAAKRYTVVDTASLEMIMNAKGGVICQFYGAAQRRDTTNATVTGTERYSLPSDFFQAVNITIKDTSGLETELKEISPEKLGDHRDDGGIPMYYRIFGDQIKIVPVNYDDDTLTIEYWATNNYIDTTGDTSNISYDFLDLWALMNAEAALTGRQTPNTSVVNHRLEIVRLMLTAEDNRMKNFNQSRLDRDAQ